MKKLLTIIGFLMFSSALFSPVISRTARGESGDSSSGSSAECTFPWTSCLHLNIPDADWSATFGKTDPKDVGQDLYENVLNMTKVSPDQKAFKNTAGAFGTTESNMVRIMNNDLGPILDKNPYLTQDQAAKKMITIQQKYQEEKEIFAFKADIEAAVTPNEMFANGDTSDSGFDLINDLDNIQKILFNKSDKIDVGGAFNESSSGGVGTSGGPGTPGSKTPAKSPSPSEGTGSTSSALTDDGTPPSDESSASAGASKTSGLGEKPSAADNPNICFADDTLDKALKDFDSKKSTDSNYKETPTTSTPKSGTGGSGTGSGSDSGENTGSTSDALTSPTEFDYQPPAVPPAAPAPAGSWLDDLPCGEVLCIQVNFIKKTASAYVDSDNCIACHVEKINEKLKETINHSLIPGKATGNLLEPGICKQATADLFAKAGIRFHAVAKPVLTPTNDDLIYGTSMVDEWEKFVNTYKPYPFYEKKIPNPKDPEQDPFVPSVADTAAKAAAAYASPATTLPQVNNSIQQAVKGSQKAVSQAAAVAEVSLQSDTDAGFFQSIRRELEQMNYFFDSFQNILHRINSQVGDLNEEHPCENLPNIKECQ